MLATGAGCGKTRVLTEKFVAMVMSDRRTSVDRIVALTFTDKAARELRDRVRRACQDRLALGEDPDYLQDLLRKLDAAPIGTFHTFCAEIVRRYAARAGVDPGFTILDESIAATCREEAVGSTLRRALVARDPDLNALAVDLGLETVRDHLVRLLAGRAADSLDVWAASEPEILIARWRKEHEERVRPGVIRQLLKSIRPCLDLLESYDCTHHPTMRDRRASLLALAATLPEAADPRAQIAAMVQHARVRGGGNRDKWPNAAIYASFSESFKALRDSHAKAALRGLVYDETSTRLASELGIRLAKMAAAARREFAAVKRRRGSLDFDDLLLHARDLIRNDAQTVRNELTNRYDLILIDEFQDTDPVQDEIVRGIAGEDFARGRLFLVGDVNQSIYGFRGARPSLFARYRDEFLPVGSLSLVENFRSRPALIDFVNSLFDKALPNYEPIVAGSADTLPVDLSSVVFAWPSPSIGTRRPVEERPAEERNDRAVPAGGGVLTRPLSDRFADAKCRGENLKERNAAARRREEATRLSRIVRTWFDDGRLVRDKETNHPRPMHAGDVAFLFRTLNDIAPYEQALHDEGLAFHVIGSSAFYTQQEVQDLVNVLTVLDDPFDSVALAGSLRSPFFALSDEALYWLSTVRRNDLFAGLSHPDESTLPDLSPRDRYCARRAYGLLTRWQGFKDREPIARLVERVMEESGFGAALLGEPLGERKRANAQKLVRIARTYDNHGGFALADFVARLRADLNHPPREEQAATTGELGEVIRLLTVHKAKGLEFPVVILPDLDRRGDGNRDRVVLDPDLGPLLKVNAEEDDRDVDTDGEDKKGSLGWLVHQQLRASEEAQEALRIFYVATTRARDLLVLSTSGEPDAKTSSPALRLLLDRFDPRSGSCLADHPIAWSTPQVEVIREVPARAVKGSRRSRPPLLALARLIENTLPPPDRFVQAPSRSRDETDAARSRMPTHIDLHPAASSSRLDRLVRAVWLDPRVFRRGALEDVAALVARRQSPVANPRLIAEAVERVRGFVEGPLGRQIAKADDVRRDITWSIVWPEGSPSGTVIEGVLDLAYRDKDGHWTVVQLDNVASSVISIQLRLSLSVRLGPRLGLDPICSAWQLAHGPGGGLKGVDRTDDSAIMSWLSGL